MFEEVGSTYDPELMRYMEWVNLIAAALYFPYFRDATAIRVNPLFTEHPFSKPAGMATCRLFYATFSLASGVTTGNCL